MIDSTIVRPPAGRHWKRAPKDQAMGRSRGGLTTKIHLLADALGRPLRIIATAGQVETSRRLLPSWKARTVMPFWPKAFDSNAFWAVIAGMGARAVIPSNRSHKTVIPRDALTYRHRKPHRAMLQSNEALPTLHHTLRPKNHPLLRLCLSGRGNDLDAVNVDWS